MARGSIQTDKLVEELRTIRKPLYEKCSKIMDDGIEIVCSRAEKGHCRSFAFPEAKWRTGDCNMCDVELKRDYVPPKEKPKVRVGQQKQKKRK